MLTFLLHGLFNHANFRVLVSGGLVMAVDGVVYVLLCFVVYGCGRAELWFIAGYCSSMQISRQFFNVYNTGLKNWREICMLPGQLCLCVKKKDRLEPLDLRNKKFAVLLRCFLHLSAFLISAPAQFYSTVISEVAKSEE